MQQQEKAPGRNVAPGRFGRLVTAVAAGLVGGLIAPLVYPAVARNARPATRKAMKVGIAAFERGREIAAEWGEHASDLMAEARAQYDEDQKSVAAAEPSSAPPDVVSLRGSGRETATS